MTQTHRWIGFLSISVLALFMTAVPLAAETSKPLEGVSRDGKKVYLGPTDLTDTPAYINYVYSRHGGGAQVDFLFERVIPRKDLIYYYEGNPYGHRDAYKTGLWLRDKRYEKGMSAREFLKREVWRSQDTGELNLVEFPDGSIHVGYYILLNELELLEEFYENDPGEKGY